MLLHNQQGLFSLLLLSVVDNAVAWKITCYPCSKYAQGFLDNALQLARVSSELMIVIIIFLDIIDFVRAA